MRTTLAKKASVGNAFTPNDSAQQFRPILWVRVIPGEKVKPKADPLTANDDRDNNLVTLAMNVHAQIDQRTAQVFRMNTLPAIDRLIASLKNNPGDSEYEVDCRDAIMMAAERRKSEVFNEITNQKTLEKIAKNQSEELEYREAAIRQISDPDVLDEILEDLKNPLAVRNAAGRKKNRILDEPTDLRSMLYPGGHLRT